MAGTSRETFGYEVRRALCNLGTGTPRSTRAVSLRCDFQGYRVQRSQYSQYPPTVLSRIRITGGRFVVVLVLFSMAQEDESDAVGVYGAVTLEVENQTLSGNNFSL